MGFAGEYNVTSTAGDTLGGKPKHAY
jgi:hypothetical protein